MEMLFDYNSTFLGLLLNVHHLILYKIRDVNFYLIAIVIVVEIVNYDWHSQLILNIILASQLILNSNRIYFT